MSVVENIAYPLHYRRTYDNGSLIGDNSYRPAITTLLDSISGSVRTPNFHNRKIKKALPFNAIQQVKYYCTLGVRLGKHVVSGPGYSIEDVTFGFWRDDLQYGIPWGHSDLAYNQAASRLRDQFNNVMTNIPLAFAERKKTVDMVANAAAKLVHAVASLKNRRFKDAFSALGIDYNKKLASSFNQTATELIGKSKSSFTPKTFDIFMSTHWLELQYGWLPLLSDVYGAAEFLAQQIIDREQVGRPFVVRSKGKSVDQGVVTASNPAFPYPREKAGSITVTSHCKLQVNAVLDSQSKAALASTGITNPALLAWELVPYSFVIDWFLPVGKYLEQINAYDGFIISDVKRVRFTRSFTTVQRQFTPYRYAFDHLTTGQVSGSWLLVNYDRDSPVLPPAVPPSFKSPISIIHATNAIALLGAVFRSVDHRR